MTTTTNNQIVGVDESFKKRYPALDVPPVLMLGPGPANVHPRVLASNGTRQIGHLDPYFVEVMDRIKDLLRYVWQTKNQTTVPMSGTGSCAMEAAIANIVEPGDAVLVAVNGYFGLRLADMAERYGGVISQINRPWGTVFSLDELEKAILQYKPRVLAIVHAETSTGACQPLVGLGDLCKAHDCYLLVDTVTSIGGLPLFVDNWGIDVCYAGTQKCLGAPPGLGPLTFSPRAIQKVSSRKTKVHSWYLDITLINSYWATGTRAYHHTAPITMNWALYTALQIIEEEGLENRWRRHRENAEYLWASLEKMGLELAVEEPYRLPSLTTVKVPEKVDPVEVIKYLRTTHNIEISGGLGELKGKIWRIGLMGYNSTKANVDTLIAALKEAIDHVQKKDSRL